MFEIPRGLRQRKRPGRVPQTLSVSTTVLTHPVSPPYLRVATLATVVMVALVAGGCGLIRQRALHDVADLLSDPQAAGVYAGDDDPELIAAALPFGLKTYEVLLAAQPRHRPLLLATASAFIGYAHAFVLLPAERLVTSDYRRAQQLRTRAARLFRRGRDYALTGLELDHPGWGERLRTDPPSALAELGPEAAPLLYWTGAGWGGAIAAEPGALSDLAELPLVEAIMRRVLVLDEGYGAGAVHEFFITYEGGRSSLMGGSAERAMHHFHRAVELAHGERAAPYLAVATTVAVQRQDETLFQEMLHKVLAIDVDQAPAWRLENRIAQEQAAWLLDHRQDLFADPEEASP